jgi:hypothetical protein
MAYDTTRRTLDVEVALTRSGELTVWCLRLADADNVRIERPSDDWDYTELTELHLSEVGGRGQLEACVLGRAERPVGDVLSPDSRPDRLSRESTGRQRCALPAQFASPLVGDGYIALAKTAENETVRYSRGFEAMWLIGHERERHDIAWLDDVLCSLGFAPHRVGGGFQTVP